jgi:hypothetical protein
MKELSFELSHLESALQGGFWKMFFSKKKSSHVVCPVCVNLCSVSHLADAFRSFCRVSFSPFLFASSSFFSFPLLFPSFKDC